MKVSQAIFEVCKLLEDKKGENIVVCDATKMLNVVDYFVFVSASSITHVKALADYVEAESAQRGIANLVCREGFNQSDWIVLDFENFFVHIFTKQKRDYYNLEKLLNEGSNTATFEKLKKEEQKAQKKTAQKELKESKQTSKTLAKEKKQKEKK